jgi:GDP-D-mannose 3',5'-epimerase
VKPPEYEPSPAHEFRVLDLRRWESCLEATSGMDHVYHLAANMGGIGFIEANKAVIVHDNTLINTHMLEAARRNGASRSCIRPRPAFTPATCRAAPM